MELITLGNPYGGTTVEIAVDGRHSEEFILPTLWAARRNGRGVVQAVVPGSGGSFWLVEHPEDESLAVYHLEELTDIKAP